MLKPTVSIVWTASGPHVELHNLQPEQARYLLAALAHVIASHPSMRGKLSTSLVVMPGVSNDAIALLQQAIETLRANPQADAVSGLGVIKGGR